MRDEEIDTFEYGSESTGGIGENGFAVCGREAASGQARDGQAHHQIAAC